MNTPEQWTRLAESWRFEHFFLVWDETHPEEWEPVFDVLIRTLEDWGADLSHLTRRPPDLSPWTVAVRTWENVLDTWVQAVTVQPVMAAHLIAVEGELLPVGEALHRAQQRPRQAYAALPFHCSQSDPRT